MASPPRDVYYRNFDLHHGPNLYVDDASLDRELDMNYYPLDEGIQPGRHRRVQGVHEDPDHRTPRTRTT